MEARMAQEIKKSEPNGTPAPRYSDPFSLLRTEMDRVFDSFLGRGSGMPSLQRSGGQSIMPSIDVRETDAEIVIEAELPGMDEKDVTVTLSGGILTLKGEKKSEREEKKDDYHLTERSYGSFQRSFRVPETVDQDQVSADFEKGVLKVAMKKRPDAAAGEKHIPIGKS
jgi:HSP20 family protein